MTKSFASWLDEARAGFRWFCFAPTGEAAALSLVVAAISGALLLGHPALGIATARMQLCAFALVPTPAGVLRQSSTLIQHLFVHIDWAHLAGNVAFLMFFGSAVSRRLAAESGGVKPHRAFAVFCGFFLACGVVGGIAFILTDLARPSCVVGASGAIAGLLGAALRFALREDRRGFDPMARVIAALAVVIAANAALSTFGEMMRVAPLVSAWQAHAGGLIFGAFAFPWFARRAR